MSFIKKLIKIISILTGTVLILLFTVSLIMQNKVAGILIRTLNSTFTTKIETGSYRLSLIKKFPKASVELKDVIVYSSPAFDKKAFRGINTDTLLKARSASVDFKIIDLLKGEYTFTDISARSGNLNLFTDTSGHYNYDVSQKASNSHSRQQVVLNLNKIKVNDIKCVYNDLRVNLVVVGRFFNGQFKSKIKNSDIDFEGKSDFTFSLFRLSDFSMKQSIPSKVDVAVSKNDKGIFFRKSTLSIESWDFILTGYIASDNYLDLDVKSGNIDISKTAEVLPEKYRKAVSDFHPAGNLIFDCKIKGKPTRKVDPVYEITWSIKNARIENRKSRIKVDKLSFDGAFTNGTQNKPETGFFRVRDFSAKLGSEIYTGSFNVSNLKSPNAELVFKGKLVIPELINFLNVKDISNPSGSVDLDLKFSGKPGRKDKYTFKDVFTLNSQSEIVFNSAGISFDNSQADIRNMSGKVNIREVTSVDNLKLIINKQKINLSGNFSNFPGWLTGNPVTLGGSATVSASSFRPELFMKDDKTAKKAPVQKAPVTLPEDVNLDVNFTIDTLTYKTFNARKISGTMTFAPRIMNFRSVNLNSQNGHIAGNCIVAQNRDKSFIGRGSFSLDGIDVNEAFSTFHNFGQNFIKAENLAGSLSGSISLILPVDSLLNPRMKSLTAEGKYVLTSGALINFEPVKALSRFIELSELENIKFDRLENDFFIKNNVFFIPMMDIKSSAADLSVNGTHSFDNIYEYHARILLSEILSNKARRNKTIKDEFGEVADDGLGRTSVFLKIKGTGEKFDVSYDLKATGNKIREDIKKEKQILKTIFDEENGLTNNDTAPKRKQSTKPRFRVIWEGSDMSSAEKEPPVQQKENPLKNLFRKKKL